MAPPPGRGAPAGYRFRIDGHLGDHWAARFGDLSLTHESDGTTTLGGPVSDQAELHGLLTKIRDLGVTLICVQAVDASGEPVWREGQDRGDDRARSRPSRMSSRPNSNSSA